MLACPVRLILSFLEGIMGKKRRQSDEGKERPVVQLISFVILIISFVAYASFLLWSAWPFALSLMIRLLVILLCF